MSHKRVMFIMYISYYFMKPFFVFLIKELTLCTFTPVTTWDGVRIFTSCIVEAR